MLIWTFRSILKGTVTEFDLWYRDLPVRAKVKIDWTLKLLQERRRHEWIAKHAKPYKGYDPLYEIRFEAENVAYRPLGAFGRFQDEFTFLAFPIKKNNSLIPKDAPNLALRNWDAILKDLLEVEDCEFNKREPSEIGGQVN